MKNVQSKEAAAQGDQLQYDFVRDLNDELVIPQKFYNSARRLDGSLLKFLSVKLNSTMTNEYDGNQLT